MKKYFTIHENDVGSEAVTTQYVEAIEADHEAEISKVEDLQGILNKVEKFACETLCKVGIGESCQGCIIDDMKVPSDSS